MKKYIFIAIALILAQNVFSQKLTREQERQFYIKALRLLEQYEDASAVYDKSSANDFVKLFASRNTNVYNDLLGISDSDSLKATEYATLLSEKAKATHVIIKNVKRGEVTENEKEWLVTVAFDKSISYSDLCGVIISSEDYYHEDYKMSALIAMDKDDEDCRIVSLDGKMESGVPKLKTNYTVINKKSERDAKATLDGKPILFNQYDQTFSYGLGSISYPDDDVSTKLVPDESSSECGHLRIKYVEKKWRVKPHFEIAFGDPLAVSSENGSVTHSSSETNFGLDLGYTFPSKSKLKLGLYSGLGFSSSKMTLGLDKLNYSYNAPATDDIDLDTYYRYYKDVKAEEEISMSHFVIPLYVNLDIKFNKVMSAYLQLGVKSYIKMSAKEKSMSASSYEVGFYPQYGFILEGVSDFNEEIGINSFGHNKYQQSDLLSADIENAKGLGFDFLGGAGLQVRLFGPVSLYAGLTFQTGLTSVIENPNVVSVSNVRHGRDQSLLTYSNKNGIEMRSLTSTFESIKRQALRLNVGLSIRL